VIKHWGVKNFKSILDQNLELAPLTIFAGANSSGKSSFLQSILVTAQSLADKGGYGINLNGKLTKLGFFDDVCSNIMKEDGLEDSKISIYYNIYNIDPDKPRQGLKSVSGNFSFSPDLFPKLQVDFAKLNSNKITDQEFINLIRKNYIEIQRRYEHPNIYVSKLFCGYENTNKDAVFKFRGFRGNDFYVTFRKHLFDLLAGYEASEIAANTELDKWVWDYLFSDEADKFSFDEESEKELREFLNGEESYKRFVLMNHFLPVPGETVYFEVKPHKDKKARLPSRIAIASKFVADYFESQFVYLGPLRVYPKPLYEYKPGEKNTDVGTRGEYTASVLYQHREDRVNYVRPDIFAKESVDEYKKSNMTLYYAVDEWISYIGIAEGLDEGLVGRSFKETPAQMVQREKMLPFRVRMSSDKYSRDLTHVGAGVSQALPIVVACLAMPEDSTIIIEHPELNLHPKMQSRLADFFIAMALSGRQCLIETHSEHIVNQLCYRYASTADEKILKDKAKIFFVEKNHDTGASNFRDIEINKYGALSEWPDDFFDEAQISNAKIFRAVTEKLEQEEKNE
jgi:predicted ATPase